MSTPLMDKMGSGFGVGFVLRGAVFKIAPPKMIIGHC